MPHKTYLSLEIGATPPDTIKQLQYIKDAMIAAIMHQADTTGITDSNDPIYQVYQSIYLQAHCTLQQQYSFAAPEG